MKYSQTFLNVAALLAAMLCNQLVTVAATPFLPNTNTNTIIRPSSTLTTTPTSTIQSTLLSLRGGEVTEPTSLQQVQDILMKASAEGKSVVIDFSATWCGPCKMISPLYHQMSEMDQFSNIIFLKIDVDESPDTAAQYNVSAMPTFLFIKQGQVVDKLMGANPDKLKEMLEELVGM